MRTLVQINKELKYFKSSLVSFLFFFVIAPIVLGLLYGALYERMLTPDIEINPIKIFITEAEGDIYLPLVRQLLATQELDFIDLEKVPPNEIKRMTRTNSSSLGIKEEEKTVQILNYGPGSPEKSIVKNLVFPLITTLSYLDVQNMTSEQRTELIQQYLLLSNKDFTTIEEVAVVQKLTSYQLMVVSVYIAMSFFITVTFVTNFLREKESAVLCRLFSIDITKKSIYINTVLAVFIISLMLVTIHSFIAYHILLKTKFSFLEMFILNIFHAGFLAGLYGACIGLFGSEFFFKTIIISLLSIIMFLGGSFYPIDTNPNLANFVHLMPNYNLLKLYEGIFLDFSLEELIYPLSFMFGATVVLFLVGMYKFLVREGSIC